MVVPEVIDSSNICGGSEVSYHTSTVFHLLEHLNFCYTLQQCLQAERDSMVFIFVNTCKCSTPITWKYVANKHN